MSEDSDNFKLVWSTNTCPNCGEIVPLELMSLQATCRCGMIYIDCDWNGLKKGWHKGFEIKNAQMHTKPRTITIEFTEDELAHLTSMMEDISSMGSKAYRIVEDPSFRSVHDRFMKYWRDCAKPEPK